MKTLVKMSFDPEVAIETDTDSAIILENIHYWIEKNRLNEKHFHENNWWTYNSKKAFEALFPWLTYDQIRRKLEKLRDKNYIKTGKFNKHTYDQTLWYTLGDNEWCQKCKLDWAKMPNGLGVDAQPIPNDKPNDKQGGEPTPPNSEMGYRNLSIKDQLLLLRSVIGIKPSQLNTDLLLERIKKSKYRDNTMETAFHWILQDLLEGKIRAKLYEDFGDGYVCDELPREFSEIEKLMDKRLGEIKQKNPSLYKELLVNCSNKPTYDL